MARISTRLYLDERQVKWFELTWAIVAEFIFLYIYHRLNQKRYILPDRDETSNNHSTRVSRKTKNICTTSFTRNWNLRKHSRYIEYPKPLVLYLNVTRRMKSIFFIRTFVSIFCVLVGDAGNFPLYVHSLLSYEWWEICYIFFFFYRFSILLR